MRSVQESLELVLGVARDRRLFFLEGAIGLLILVEVILALAGRLSPDRSGPGILGPALTPTD